MELVRILHPSWFDRTLKRYQSVSLISRKKPLSVFDKQCSIESSGCPCNHIQRFYADIAHGDIIYLEFHSSILPMTCTIQQQDSNTDDKCHYNISGITEKIAKAILPKDIGSFKICDDAN